MVIIRQKTQYSDEELKEAFLKLEKKLGRTPRSRDLIGNDCPSVNYYIQGFKSWNKFLLSMGREIQKRSYTRKPNPKRFFYPAEFNKFVAEIKNSKHKFVLEFLLNTGARYDEAKKVEVRDINLDREMVLIKYAKGGHGRQREVIISSDFARKIESYLRENNIGKLDNLNFPSIQYAEKMIKKYCKAAGINDPENFSCHTFRKTLENWLVALNVNIFEIQQHMGHTLDVAHVHYIANQYITQDDKVLIRSILGNLFQK